MLTPLQREIVEDLLYMERDTGPPTLTLTFNGTTAAYPAVASITSFKREIDTGGYRKVQLLSATLRILNWDGSVQFPVLPQAQQLVTCSVDGLAYRIEEVKVDPTGSRLRLIAEGPAKGI